MAPGTIRAMDGTTVDLKGGMVLSYREQGRGSGPAVVFLPGPTDSWVSYEPVLAHLPPSLHAVAVSQRGHGDSTKPESGYMVPDFAADVVALLDGLGITKAVLVGHSGSCLVARRVAIDAPDRVSGLVLEASPTTLRGDPRLESFVGSVIADLRDPIPVAFARSVITDTSSEDLTDETVDRLVAELLKVPSRVWRETLTGVLQYDDSSELGDIQAPALLIWGDADDLVSRAMQEELLAALPQAELVVHAGAGHTPRWEDPARFAADLADFAHRCGAP